MQLEMTEVWATYRSVRTYDRPFHLGNAWRGSFGWSLRCVSPRAYVALYDSKVPSPSPLAGDLVSGADCPRPLVPILPPPGRRALERGEHLQVGLRLFGSAWREHRGAVLDALADLAPRLRSRPTDDANDGPALTLDEVNVGPTTRTKWSASHALREPVLGHMKVQLVTPTRLRIKGEPEGRPSFARMLRLAHGRLRMLGALYGDGPTEPLPEAWSELAKAVRLDAVDTTELRWEAPADQGAAWRPMRGWLGSWGYYGPVHGFVDLLGAAEKVHLGSDTMYGLGRVSVSLAYPVHSLT